jgi:hypothetical protein
MFWIKLTAAVLLLLVALQVGLSRWGAAQWEQGTQLLRSKLQAAQRPSAVTHFDAGELEALPVPVQRYFRVALKDGQAMVKTAHVMHTGSFNMSATGRRSELGFADRAQALLARHQHRHHLRI